MTDTSETYEMTVARVAQALGSAGRALHSLQEASQEASAAMDELEKVLERLGVEVQQGPAQERVIQVGRVALLQLPDGTLEIAPHSDGAGTG